MRNPNPLTLALLLAIAVVPMTPAQDAGGRFLPDRKSKFDAAGKRHNPFWPIGYKVEKTSVRQEPPKRQVQIEEIPPGTLAISSILMGNPPLAVINEGEYTLGDEIPATIDGREVRLQLVFIGDGFVRVRAGNRIYTVRR